MKWVISVICLMTLQVGFCFALNEAAIEKMWKNSLKAYQEHIQKSPCKDAFINIQSFSSTLKQKPIPTSFGFLYHTKEAQGKREAMEDAHFYQECREGILLGVFDGHGGHEVAHFAAKAFQQRFFQQLQNSKRDIHNTFYELFKEIHEEVIYEHPTWESGTTAVLCFVDTLHQCIFTATLGDSEANLYRKDKNGELKSIPLSCIRDFSHPKDSKRAAAGMNMSLEKYLALQKKEQEFYGDQYKFRFIVGNLRRGYRSLNVSRAIGDRAFCLFKNGKRAGVSQKPKITVHPFQKGDILILACDGLKDYVTEKEIINQIENRTTSEIASSLVSYAIEEANSLDNVTVSTLAIF